MPERPGRERRVRRWMLLLAALLLLAVALNGWFGRGVPMALQQADSLEAFEAVLQKLGAPRAAQRQPGAAVAHASIDGLKAALLVDSLMLVPGYAGLLLLYLAQLHRMSFRPRDGAPGVFGISWREWSLQGLCLLVALAAMFDVAENGMTARAAEDTVAGLLAPATVEDVHLATTLKWLFIGLSCAALGALAVLASSPVARGWSVALAAASALAAVLLVPQGLWPAWSINAGGLAFGLVLALAGVLVWRRPE